MNIPTHTLLKTRINNILVSDSHKQLQNMLFIRIDCFDIYFHNGSNEIRAKNNLKFVSVSIL